jgi:flavin reductase (DIM6/NTAB) family NADH-FMN oxidoreductase RutF
MTVSFFSEVAHYPTALWVSIADDSYTHELIEATDRFSLIVLHKGQGDVARACGVASGRDTDKCASLNLYRAHQEFWFLDGALASVACRVRSLHAAEKHTLFIADILAAEFETRSRVRRHLLTTDLAPCPSAVL